MFLDLPLQFTKPKQWRSWKFLRKLDLPICSILTEDFNAKCSILAEKWYHKFHRSWDWHPNNNSRIQKIIDTPTHVINNSSSCFDIIFCNNNNILTKYVNNFSIFEKNHHKIIYGKINIRIPLPTNISPWRLGLIYKYWKYVNIENINKALFNFYWNEAFENLSIDRKVELLNKNLLNIFQKSIPNKRVKFDYCQSPWMIENLKKSSKERAKLAKYYDRYGQKKEDVEKLLAKAKNCTNEILEDKD